MIPGIAFFVWSLVTYSTLLDAFALPFGLLGVWLLYKIKEIEVCILDKEQNKLVLKRRWFFGLSIREYSLDQVVNIESIHTSPEIHTLVFLLKSGAEIPLLASDIDTIQDVGIWIGKFLFPQAHSVGYSGNVSGDDTHT